MAYGHITPVGVDTYLNTVTYPVELPEYALPKHPAFESGELEPFFIPDKNALVVSRITIAQMIDFKYRVIKFQILKAEDILEIHRYLSSYVSQLSEYSEVEEAAKFIAKCRYLVDDLEKSITILSKRNPKAMEILRRNSLADLFKSTILPVK
jgi:hypothetical protein